MVKFFRNIHKKSLSGRQKNIELLHEDSVNQVLQILNESLEEIENNERQSEVDLIVTINKKVIIKSINNKVDNGNYYLNDFESNIVGLTRINNW